MNDFGKIRIGGLIKGESKIAYAIDLPKLLEEETGSFLQELANHFLSFLEKESKKPCDILRFGGLDCKKQGNSLTLSVAFCPFEERKYLPKAILLLNDEGKIIDIEKGKRSRRKTS